MPDEPFLLGVGVVFNLLTWDSNPVQSLFVLTYVFVHFLIERL